MRFLLICLRARRARRLPEAAQQRPTNQAAAAAEAGPAKGVDRSHKGQPAPDASFNDPDGEATSLAAVPGQADAGEPVGDAGARRASRNCRRSTSWPRRRRCGSSAWSRSARTSGPHAVGRGVPRRRTESSTLGAYQDPKMALSGALGAERACRPRSCIDANGKEVWRYVGDLDWTSAEGG